MKTIIILSSVCILGYEINRKSKGIWFWFDFIDWHNMVWYNILSVYNFIQIINEFKQIHWMHN